MPAKSKRDRKAFVALSAEMNVPHVAASAMFSLNALRPRSRTRKLNFVDDFYGYACSRCGCRFPESRPPKGRTPAEARRLTKLLCDEQFAEHICPTA